MESDAARWLRVALGSLFARSVTSERRQRLARGWRRIWRHAARRLPTVHYFHQADDPYSQLAASQLDEFCARYPLRLETHAVPPPDRAAAPQAEALRRWSQRDAARWAQHFGLAPPEPPCHPDELALAHRASPRALEAGAALRRRLGHYLGGMFYCEGEWYWGLDRLHYLESRLSTEMQREAAPTPLFLPPALQFAPTTPTAEAPTLDFFCSLRSPYTWLATPRVRALAKHYGATLRLRFVLPMVMRGLPVPLAKRLYILKDTKREALRLGLPFGDVADPVGLPTERGLALLHHAVQQGCGEEFLESFLRGVFAEGIDAGSRRGLERIAIRAGLNRANLHDALADHSWRALADAHREDLLAAGLWGVPSFRVNGLPALWGQDRLWMIEQDLRALSAS
ncbi:MAG: DsbA family protein [Gammaproteobacteria bacterium]|jgi:2-hydroxychromene-2-carboxylate isomerase